MIAARRAAVAAAIRSGHPHRAALTRWLARTALAQRSTDGSTAARSRNRTRSSARADGQQPPAQR